jgi:hypothetical protein
LLEAAEGRSPALPLRAPHAQEIDVMTTRPPASSAPDNLITNPLDKPRRKEEPGPGEKTITEPAEERDPGDNLITNPLDKPGAGDNLIRNPLDKR